MAGRGEDVKPKWSDEKQQKQVKAAPTRHVQIEPSRTTQGCCKETPGTATSRAKQLRNNNVLVGEL